MQSGVFRRQLLKDKYKVLQLQKNIEKFKCEGLRANLLLQGLHGHELNVVPLFADPGRFVGNQYPQNQFNQDQHVLQTEQRW